MKEMKDHDGVSPEMWMAGSTSTLSVKLIFASDTTGLPPKPWGTRLCALYSLSFAGEPLGDSSIASGPGWIPSCNSACLFCFKL